MREIWLMQPRFDRRTPGGAATLVEQARFRAGFDFLRLRADAGEIPAPLAQWWETYSMASAEERPALIDAARQDDQSRRASGGSPAASVPARSAEAGGEPAAAADPARKRRRRRRKAPGEANANHEGNA
jgi:poly(A) polymerase